MGASPGRRTSPRGESAPRRKPPATLRRTGQDPAVAEPTSWAYRAVWGTTLTLVAFGLLMVFSASSVVGLFKENADGFFYLRQQAVTAAAGLVGLFALSRIDYRRLTSYLGLAAFVSVVMLLLVKLPGAGRDAGGATRWLDLGFVSLQPSEVAKLTTVGLAAYLLSTRRALKGGADRLLLPLGPVVVAICLLILSQPDLGTAVMVAGTVMGMLWVAGLPKRWWFGLAAAGSGLAVFLMLTADYRRERLLAFLDPGADPQGSGFLIIQSLVAIGSGGLFGVGPGRSVQKFSYLPEAHTDMIFAIVGEEFGFVGLGVVIGLFGVFAVSAWKLASRCVDPFGRYLVAGALMLIVGQAVLNMGGVLGALPLTGVPLPFISFGRTNLLVMLAAVGLILSVARYGPVAAVAPAGRSGAGQEHPSSNRTPDNVEYLDRRRRHRRTRGSRPRHS